MMDLKNDENLIVLSKPLGRIPKTTRSNTVTVTRVKGVIIRINLIRSKELLFR